MTLEEAYQSILTAPTDIRHHVPILRDLAVGKHVVEFGTRRGVSTVAMLAGRPASLITYDIHRCGDVDGMEKMAKEAGIPFEFRQEDIDKLEYIPECDLVFVDAEHAEPNVAIHLRLAHNAWAHVIACHDTASFARVGSVGNTRGVLDAIEDFMAEYPEWRITYQTEADYGLTVIKRNDPQD